MKSKWEGIRCKSYTLPGEDGGELVIAETIDRQAIEVSIRQNGEPHLTDSLSVRISAAQFEALCKMDSAYDGLEVEKPAEVEEPMTETERINAEYDPHNPLGERKNYGSNR